jgi:hypothetical protein
MKGKFLPTLSLFTSMSTLICCALPALLVSLGAGASLAGFIGAFPQITWFSEYKILLFIGSGVMMALSGFWMWKSRNAPCPIDPEQAKACTRLRVINKWVYGVSVSIWLIGFFFAFLASKFI